MKESKAPQITPQITPQSTPQSAQPKAPEHAALAENIGKWAHVTALTLFAGQTIGKAIESRRPQLFAKLPTLLRSSKTCLMLWGISGFASSAANQMREVAASDKPKDYTAVKQGFNIAGLVSGTVSFVTLKQPIFRFRTAALSSLWLGNVSPIIDSVTQPDKTKTEKIGLAANVLNSGGLAASIFGYKHAPYVLWAKAGLVNGVGNVIEKVEQEKAAGKPITTAETLGYAGITIGGAAVGVYAWKGRNPTVQAVEIGQTLALCALDTKAVDSGIKSANKWQAKIAQENLVKAATPPAGKSA